MNTVKEELIKQYKYKIEAHAHTSPISTCSQVMPEEMAEIYHKLGYDAVVITNHFIYEQMQDVNKDEALKRYIDNYYETKKAGEKYGIEVLLGAEIRFTENNNDYLIYGVDKDILSVCYDYLKKGIKTFRNEVELKDSVFVQAHPKRDGMELVDPSLLDGIETLNLHPGHNSRVGIATKYANENGIKIKIAGSDFHHKNQNHEGVSALLCKTLPKTSFELAKILKSGDYILEIGGSAIVLP